MSIWCAVVKLRHSSKMEPPYELAHGIRAVYFKNIEAESTMEAVRLVGARMKRYEPDEFEIDFMEELEPVVRLTESHGGPWPG